MGKTFDQSLIDTANINMSMIDPDDMQDTNSEEFKSMRRIQQGCHNELTNKEEFPFNKYKKIIQTQKKQALYSMPEGLIKKVTISSGNQITQLKYDDNFEMYGDSVGKPELFTVTNNPYKLKLYPVPDKTYTVQIEYISTKNVILSDGSYSYDIAVNSTLRMPEQYQHLYFDALEYYVLAVNMRKVSNPRYEPTLAIFRERWNTFIKSTKPVDAETIFTI